jgi:hypothetical protein
MKLSNSTRIHSLYCLCIFLRTLLKHTIQNAIPFNYKFYSEQQVLMNLNIQNAGNHYDEQYFYIAKSTYKD